MTTVLALITVALTGATIYRLEKHMATNQDRLDALSTQLVAAKDQAHKAHHEIVTQIEELKIKGADLDFTALENAAADLGASTQRLDDIVADPELVAPAPEPVTEPVAEVPEPATEPEPEPELVDEPELELDTEEAGPATETPSA